MNQITVTYEPQGITSRKNRNELQLISTVLYAIDNALEGKARKTHITHMADMNTAQMKKLEPVLFNRGLVERTPDGFWRVTDKGKEYLQTWNSLTQILA